MHRNGWNVGVAEIDYDPDFISIFDSRGEVFMPILFELAIPGSSYLIELTQDEYGILSLVR